MTDIEDHVVIIDGELQQESNRVRFTKEQVKAAFEKGIQQARDRANGMGRPDNH